MAPLITKLLNEMALEEMPLPSDWDKKIFSPNVPFSKQLKYARERAAEVGKGSSRVAFKIPYEGRDTVLKLAMNIKGMAQNEYEIRYIFEDYYLTDKLKLVIPGIDYDEVNDRPTWVHTEFAFKMHPIEFKKFFGGNPVELLQYAFYEAHKPHAMFGGYVPSTYKNINPDSPHTQKFVDFIANYDTDNIGVGDFQSLSNWGVYKDRNSGEVRPVIIDFGLSSEIYKTYY